MQHCLTFLLAALYACILNTINAQSSIMPKKLVEFVESQERVVKIVAQRATALHAERTQHVRACKCSKHGCSNDYMHVPCTKQFGTPVICEASGRRVDRTMSDFLTPPGANFDNLSSSLIEDVCVYQNLDETFKRIYGQEEYGWLYLG